MRTAVAVALACATLASAETVAITNARVFPISSAPIDRATVLIRDGRVAAVGTKVEVPRDAHRIDATGLSVYPGWIDSWTYVGLAEISSVAGSVDTTEIGAFNPGEQAWIAVNPHSEMIRTARVNGVSTALVAPRGAALVAGTASAVDLLGNYPSEMAILKNVGVVVNIPSVNRGGGRGMRGAGARQETAEARRRRVQTETEKLKDYFGEARRYSDMRARSGAGTPPAAIDDALEAMVPVMRGERPIIVPADNFRDIEAAVNFANEMKLKLLIAGGADAWKVAELLAKNNVGVLYSAVHTLPISAEDPYDATFTAPEILRRAGVKFAIASGTADDLRNLPYRAAMAAAYGLEREDALKSITQWPADLLGIGSQVGSIEPGKLANLLVSRGDPLDVRAEIKYVFVNGRQVPPENRNLQMYEEFRPRDSSQQ